MKLVRLLAPPLVAAAAAWAYRRFLAGRGEGREETESAQPYSSDGPHGVAPAADVPAAEGTQGEQGDALTHPTWLKPGDSG